MASNEPAAFGELLRRNRLAAGLTQEALAELAGMSSRGIADLERGARRWPYPATVRRLAEGLGLAKADWAALQTAARPAPPVGGPGHQEVADRAPIRRHNLSSPRTSLIGREHDEAVVRQALLEGGHRLVTLTGAGGCGKTRLALAVGASSVDVFAEGVWLVELGSLVDPSLLPHTVALSLGVREDPSRPILDTLLLSLKHTPAAAVAGQLRAPDRGLCGIRGSAAGELPRGAAAGNQPRAACVSLARPPGRYLRWTCPDQRPDQSLDECCALSSGSAVSRTGASRAAGIRADHAERLKHRAHLPTTRGAATGDRAGGRVAASAWRRGNRRAAGQQYQAAGGWQSDRSRPTADPASHSGLESCIAQPREQVLFRELAVFAGGWTLEAAEAVCADDDASRVPTCSTWSAGWWTNPWW